MGKAGYNGGDLTLEFVLAEHETLTAEQKTALEALRASGL
jgi:hypothetical protein